MLNHLPEGARKTVTREYFARVVVVMLFLLGSSLLIVAILHVPTVVSVYNQLQASSQQFAAAASQSESFKASETEVALINRLAGELLASADRESLISYYSAVEQYSNRSVVVTGFSVERAEGEDVPASLQVTGRATTREALAAFQRQLEADVVFARAELPISNLAQRTDINFVMTLVPANPGEN